MKAITLLRCGVIFDDTELLVLMIMDKMQRCIIVHTIVIDYDI